MKKLIYSIQHLFWNTLNRPRMGGVQIGKHFRSCGLIRVRNRGQIIIGDKVTINSAPMANPIGGQESTILVAQRGAKITIGDGAGLSNCAIFASKSVTVGKQVMVGAGVKIYDTDFHPVIFAERMENKPPKKAAVLIEDGAFIGAHSIILKGATIGKRSVIGAGSVVTGRIPDDEIWAGNPAKFIRKIENRE